MKKSTFQRDYSKIVRSSFPENLIWGNFVISGTNKTNQCTRTLYISIYSEKVGKSNQSANIRTTWKVSIFGVILVRIFSHSDWIRTRITPNTDTFHALTVWQHLLTRPWHSSGSGNTFWRLFLYVISNGASTLITV